MARRSQPTAEVSVNPVTPEVKPVVHKPETVTLRLKQNDFIAGVFAKKGTTITLSRQEAERRLAKEAKWEFVS